MKRVQERRLHFAVPQTRVRLRKEREMHFHFTPELFLQTGGWTEFTFPGNEVHLLERGCVFLIPRGIPHSEAVGRKPDEPFQNIVVGFYSHTVSVHLAHEESPGEPEIEEIRFFRTPYYDALLHTADLLAQLARDPQLVRQPGTDGCLLTLFSLLSDMLRPSQPDVARESNKVFQAKWHIRTRLSDVHLNVSALAAELNCSRDYLSHLFVKETGKTLTRYINEQRIKGAREALVTTSLTISEIAWACGFADTGYFCRVFRKLMGISPGDYRKKHGPFANEPEKQPKTIYHDHVDFGFRREERSRAALEH